MEIVKVYKESMPHVKLAGRRYTDRDRDESGTFARYWQECFREGWLETLKDCGAIPGVSGDLVGAMRMTGGDGGFEYWIGALLAPDAEIPADFESADIPAGEVGVCWLCGNDKNGELYGMEASDMSMAAFSERNWEFFEKGWFFERYNCTRFTVPDERGNVILDICAYLMT